MKHFSKLLTLLLAGLTILMLLAGCADPEKTPSEQTSPTKPATSGEDEDDPYNIPDSLPATDFDKRELNLCYYNPEQFGKTFYVDDYTGDLVDTAVYKSVTTVADRFNVKVNAFESGASDDNAHIDLVKRSISTQDGTFDLAHVHDALGGMASLEGYFLNLYDVEHIDFTKPWWPDNAVKSLTFQDKLYLGSSCMSYHGMGYTRVIFFNKTMFTNESLPYPYTAVLDGDWYMEDIISMSEAYYQDLNDNGKDNEDIYGWIVPNTFYCWFESFGIDLVQKNGDELVLNANCDEVYTLIDDLYGVLLESDGGYLAGEADAKTLFSTNHALFTYGKLNSTIDVYRATDLDYGILPVPKLDENQEQYFSAYNDRFFVIPNNCTDPEFVGFLMEALSAEGYRTIYPAYYETALKKRYAHDSETAQVLDMIQKYRVIDFTYVYFSGRCFSRSLYDLLTTKQSKDYASLYRSGESAANQRITELTEAFSKLK